MKLKFLLLFLLTITSFNITAQENKDSNEETDNHGHSKNEIAIAISAPYFTNEEKLSLSLHLHYIYNIPKTKFGIGVSYEAIILDPKHNTFGIVTTYSLLKHLSLALSPGISFENGDSAAFFSLHTEISYGFEIGKLHVGPVLEFSYDPNDTHISLGLHVGFGF